MEYQLQFNYCAVLIYSIVLFTHLSRKQTKEKHNRIFTILILIGLTGGSVNILNTYGNMNPGVFHQVFLNLLNYIYFFALVFAMFFFFIYTITLTRNNLNNISNIMKVALYFPIIGIVGVILSNPFTEAIFYYENGIYTRGKQQFLLYVIGFYYVTFGVIWVLREKKFTSLNLKLALASYYLIGCTSVIVQLFVPELLLQHLGFSACQLIILLNLQKPEEYLDSELEIYNKIAFERIFALNRNSNLEFSVIYVYVEGMDAFAKSMGADSEKAVLKEIAKYLDKISKRNAYYMENSTFFLIYEEELEKIDNLVAQIDKRFKGKWKCDIGEINTDLKMMTVLIPNQIDNIETLYFCNSSFRKKEPQKGNVIDIKEIDFQEAGHQIKLKQIIKKAISEDNFQIYYQPIYSIKENRIVSAEALIRLIDPEEGFISPGEFIPIAEKNGSIIKIGEMVFDKVFAFIRDREISNLGIKYIEINLSVIQCMQKGLANQIIQLIDKYGISRKAINLEITETAAADSPKILLENMRELSKENITFSLDDFGTGYSNISALMSMPLDIIKFDKSMIDMVTTFEYGRVVIDSSIAMVKRMGLEIVAEGVEELRQLDMLKEMGVDFIQGYYFSKPLPEEEFIEYLKTS